MRACGLWLAISFTVAPLVLVTAAATLCVLIAVCIAVGKEYGPTLSLFLTVSGLVVSYGVAIAAHEAGHVLASGVVGWTAQFVRVGPVTWRRHGERWRVGWSPRSSWLTGKVETVVGPPHAWRLVVFILAGPVANFVLGAIAVGIVVVPIPLLLRCEAGLLALISLCLGAWSLVPLRERGEASDGLNLWRLLAYGALPVTIKKLVFEPVGSGRR